MSLIKEKITAISKSQRFFVAALFFIVGILIVSIFPTAAKFEFKFEKEGIWHKEAITAPFQFSIYKLPEQERLRHFVETYVPTILHNFGF